MKRRRTESIDDIPQPKRRAGRPRVYDALLDLQISITPEQRDWLEDQPTSISETIRRLIDRAMKF